MTRTLARLAAGWWIVSLALGAAALGGCAEDLPLKTAGQYCQRDDQCLEGLICLSHRCTDAPEEVVPRPVVRTDSGPPPMDAGTDAGPDEDAGTDAGPDEDAGTDAGPDEDAGTDAGPDEDAGTDAGT